MLLSAIAVTNTLDDGSSGSLRWAVGQANLNAGADTITFNPAVFAKAQTITLTAGQLELSDPAAISITGPAAGVTVSGGGLSRVFQVDVGVTATISGLTIAGGKTSGDGGGLNNFGTVALTDCTVSGNTANGGNGSYSSFGGGFENSGGDATLINCTISGNTVNGWGGGMEISGGLATLINCTISNNVAGYGGSGLYVQVGLINLTNTIVAGNRSSNGAVSDIDDDWISFSGTNNLIGTDGSGGLRNGHNGNIVGVSNPGLAPLGNYGGPTQTMPLLPGSPAIDAGIAGAGVPTTDQRGQGRVGQADIGAFESQGFTFASVASSTPQTSAIGMEFTNPLAVTVTAKNAIEPVDRGIVNFAVNPAANGALAFLSAGSAIITGDQAAVTAEPDNVLGSYTVNAGTGVSSATFSLTNTGQVLTSLVVNTTTNDSAFPGPGHISLREAVAIANTQLLGTMNITFDPIVFAMPQTITLTAGQLELTHGDVMITGPAAGLTVSGGGLSRVFQVDVGVTVTISGLTIADGKPNSYRETSVNGGGLNNLGTTTLVGCTVSGNTAYGFNKTSSGGGLSNIGGTLTLTDCTICGNNAYVDNTTYRYAASGGGLSSIGGSLTLTGCTVSGNTATINNSYGNFYNTFAGSGMGISVVGGTAILTDTIVASNSCGPDFNRSFTSSDISGAVTGINNLIGTGGSGGLINGTSGNIVGVANPGLAPLGSYGGSTQTIALLPGSPAIDAGTSGVDIPDTDQRGMPRVGAVDIGAFESQGFTSKPVIGSTPQTSAIGTAFANPLALSVTANNPTEPVNGGIVSFAINPVANGASAILSGTSAVISNGGASVTAIANGVVGTFGVSATANGASQANFSLNNALISGLGGTTTFVQGTAPISIASTTLVFQLPGVNIASSTITFNYLQPGDRFDFYNQFALQHTFVENSSETSATLTFTGVDTAAHYQATLASVRYWCVAGQPSTEPRYGTFKVTDVAGNSGSGQQNVTVALVSQPPSLSMIESTPLTYQANNPVVPPQAISATLSIYTPASNNLTSATVAITSGYQNNASAHDLLAFASQFGITGAFNAGTGTLTLTGLSSVSNYRNALRSVTFSSSGTAVSATPRTLTITVIDGTLPTPNASNSVTRTVTVSSVAYAPPILSGLAASATYVKGSTPLVIAPNLAASDSNSTQLFGTTISFTNWQAGDRLDFYNQFALQHTFTEDLVAHTAALTITGPTTLANYQTMLQSIGFYSVAGNPDLSTRGISIAVNDGVSNSNTVTGSISVTLK